MSKILMKSENGKRTARERQENGKTSDAQRLKRKPYGLNRSTKR